MFNVELVVLVSIQQVVTVVIAKRETWKTVAIHSQYVSLSTNMNLDLFTKPIAEMVNVLTSVEAACGSAGTCVDHDGGFTCQCTDGYEESGAYPYTTCANIEGAILLLPFLLLVAIICVDNESAFSCEFIQFIQIPLVPASMNVTTVIQTLEIVEREPVSTMMKDSLVHVKLDTNQLELVQQLLVSALMTALLTLDDEATVFTPIQTELTHVIAISESLHPNLMEFMISRHVSILINAIVQLQLFLLLNVVTMEHMSTVTVDSTARAMLATKSRVLTRRFQLYS